MTSLDFELGQLRGYLSEIATKTDNNLEGVIRRMVELFTPYGADLLKPNRPKPQEDGHRGPGRPRKAVNIPNSHVVGSPVLEARDKEGHKVGARFGLPSWLEEARRLKAYGRSYRQIADKFGTSPGSVHRYLVYGNPQAPKPRPRTERLHQVRELAAQGLDAYEISEKVGITPSGVLWYHRKYGFPIKMRKPNWKEVIRKRRESQDQKRRNHKQTDQPKTQYWQAMTPEQRSAEMVRRRQIAEVNHAIRESPDNEANQPQGA